MPLYPSPKELEYARFLEAERIGLTAQAVVYYTLTRGGNVDPLYGEPTDAGWLYDEFSLLAAVTYQEMDNREVGVRDEGLTVDYDAEAFIAYNEWTANGPPTVFGDEREPKAGDVIYIMGEYFDVIRGDDGGNLIDQTKTVGHKLMLRKKAKFDAQRRLNNG
jgi:hypothetical protein